MKNAIVKREAAPAVVQGGKVDFSEVVAHCQGDNAALIRWHIEAANTLGRMSLAHAIFAGWLLERQKAQIGWGGWQNWCEANLAFSKDTADHYIALYKKTVGAARTPAGIGAGQLVSAEELAAATEAVDASTATGAMVELGIVKRNGKWGGPREGSGRKPKDPAAEVAAAAGDPDLNWAEVSGYLRGIREFAVEGDGFGTLADDDLESAVVILTEAAERARALLAARRENGGSAEAVSRIRAELAPDVPCVRADKDGYCTGPCEGSICARCSEYRPVGRGL